MGEKYLRWTLLCLGIVFIVLYVFRERLTTFVTNQALIAHNIQLTCLSWHISVWSEITVDKVCIEADEFDAIVNNARIRPNIITVNDIELVIKKQHESNVKELTPFEVELPIKRPLIEVQSLSIISEHLPKPINLLIKEQSLNRFTLNGDLEASLLMESHLITLSMLFISPLIKDTMPEYINQLQGDIRVKYDGLGLIFNSSLLVKGGIDEPNCRLSNFAQGDLSAVYDLQTSKITADLTNLELLIDQNCHTLLYKELPNIALKIIESAPIAQWKMHFPKLLEVKQGVIETEQLLVQSVQHDTHINLQNIKFTPTGKQFKTEIIAHHTSKALGEMTLTGKVENNLHGIQGQLTAKHQIPEIEFEALKANKTTVNSNITLSTEQGVSNVSLLLKANIEKLNSHDHEIKNTGLHIESLLTFAKNMHGNARVNLEAEELNYQDTLLKELQGKFILSLAEKEELKAESELNIGLITHAQHSVDVRNMTHKGLLTYFTSLDNPKISYTGTTTIPQSNVSNIKVPTISINSQVNVYEQTHLTHDIKIDDLTMIASQQLSPSSKTFKFDFPKQDVKPFNTLITQIAPNFTLTQGEITFQAKGDLVQRTSQFNGQLSNISLLYESYYLDDLGGIFEGKSNLNLVNIEKSDLSIAQIRSGAVLTDLKAQLAVVDNSAYLENISAKVFSGQIALPKYDLTASNQKVTMQVENLDLAQMSQPGRETGVELSGKVSGTLPIFISSKGISIKNGKLFNSAAGSLKITENQTMNTLKEQQPSLKTVISLLDNVDIELLSSSVELQPDGWLNLGVKMKGENKAQAQPVHFNYTHSENIFTLFKALSLSDEITQKVQDTLNK